MPKNPYPNYLIEIDDTRFPVVFEGWILGAFNQLTEHKDDPLITLTDHLEFNLITSKVPPSKSIPVAIYGALKIMRESHIDAMIIGFPAAQVPILELGSNLIEFLARRRRFDYEIRLFSTHSLSVLIDSINKDPYSEDHLLDYPMPNLNLLVINYNGTKNFLS